MKTILGIVGELNKYGSEQVICAKKEWTPQSEADVFDFDPGCRIPEISKQQGLAYFLEISVALEFLEGLEAPASWTAEQVCERLIQYALNDA
jgi:hypothetical protein